MSVSSRAKNGSFKRSDSDRRGGSGADSEKALSRKNSNSEKFSGGNANGEKKAEPNGANNANVKSTSTLAKRDSEREKAKDKTGRRLTRVPEFSGGSGTPSRGETSFLDTTINSFARLFRTPSFKNRRESLAVSRSLHFSLYYQRYSRRYLYALYDAVIAHAHTVFKHKMIEHMCK